MDKLVCETSELKEFQGLNQLREWIEKNPKIKKCRTDDQFLIRFLRMRKFNIVESYQWLEKYLITRKQLPHLFENLNIEDLELKNFLTWNSVFPLPDVDSQGRIVIFMDSRKVYGKRFSVVDCIRMGNLCIEHLSFDERSQNNGIVVVMDISSQNYEFIRLWTPVRIKEYLQCMENNFPVRFKKIILVNMTPLWSTLFQIVKIFLSDKMKSRIQIVKEWDEVFNELDINNFPQEIGGRIPASEMAEDLRKRLLENQENILSLNDSDIDISKPSGKFTSNYDAELEAMIIGSFRKIAVD